VKEVKETKRPLYHLLSPLVFGKGVSKRKEVEKTTGDQNPERSGGLQRGGGVNRKESLVLLVAHFPHSRGRVPKVGDFQREEEEKKPGPQAKFDYHARRNFRPLPKAPL